MLIFRKLSFWLALLGVLASASLILKLRAGLNQAVPPPPIKPITKTFENSLGAAGIVEARSENTLLAAPAPGLITQVHVKVWDKVEVGQTLVTLDTRDLRAAVIPQKAQVRVAEATLQRLRDQLARLEAINDPRAVSAEEIKLRRSDVTVAEAQLEAARSAVVQTETLIDRLSVKAPISGTILQVNVRAGEYASPSSQTPLMILGAIDEVQVRADVDEQLAPRVKPGSRAMACVKGDSKNPIPLEFVRIEPFILPKRSLTGASVERVDTRVLQVIFKFTRPTDKAIYVGQQMDITIEEAKSEKEAPAGQGKL